MPTAAEVLKHHDEAIKQLQAAVRTLVSWRLDALDTIESLQHRVQALEGGDLDIDLDLGGAAALPPVREEGPATPQVDAELARLKKEVQPAYQVDEDEGIVDIVPPTAGQRALREVLAEQIGWEHWTRHAHTDVAPLPPDEAKHAFIEGGPFWLYAYDRNFVMEQTPTTRKRMIEDLAIQSTVTAEEVARDILKDEDVQGGTMDVAAANILSVTEHNS